MSGSPHPPATFDRTHVYFQSDFGSKIHTLKTPSSSRPSAHLIFIRNTSALVRSIQQTKNPLRMTALTPRQPATRLALPIPFTGLTNPITGAITCRGYCDGWERKGKRCDQPRSRKAKESVKRISLAALDEQYVGPELWDLIDAEVDCLCCLCHRSWVVTDEVCFLIGEYRVKVPGWAREEMGTVEAPDNDGT